MADLGTLNPNAAVSAATNDWAVGAVADIDEPIASADGNAVGDDSNVNGDPTGRYALANVPTDFSSMDSVAANVRYRVIGAQTNARTLFARIVTDEVTPVNLTDEVQINGTITTTSFVNSGAVTLTNPTGSKAQWDNAVIALRLHVVKSMAGDTNGIRVDAVDVTGTYTAAAAGTDVTPATIVTTATLPTPAILAAATTTPVAVANTTTLPVASVLAASMVNGGLTQITVVVPTPAAGAPTNVTPATIATTVNVTELIHYEIYRRSPSTGAVFTAGTDTPIVDNLISTERVDSNLAIGTYDYQVFRSSPGVGYSSGSNVESVTIPVYAGVIATTVTVPTPSAGAGGTPATVTPAAIATSVTVPTPTAQGEGAVTPAAIVTTVSVPTPTVNVAGAGTATPATIAVVVAIPSPSVQAGAVASPVVVGLAVVIPTPSTGAAPTATPGVIAAVVALPDPTVTGVGIASPQALVLVAALPTPLAFGGVLPFIQIEFAGSVATGVEAVGRHRFNKEGV